VRVVFEEAAEALTNALLLGAETRRVVGNAGQVGMLATSQPADQGHQRVEVFLTMPARMWLIELHDRPFYGTIPQSLT
jgi:hypothetical protein